MALEIVATVAPLKVTVKVSFASYFVSPLTVTLTVLEVCPVVKVSAVLEMPV